MLHVSRGISARGTRECPGRGGTAVLLRRIHQPSAAMRAADHSPHRAADRAAAGDPGHQEPKV